MTNPIGMSAVLQDQTGHVCDASSMRVFCVAISSALVGSLTLTGMTQANGAAQSWVIAPGTSGYVAPPGIGVAWRLLAYTLSNPADVGKAVVAWANQ